MATADIVHASSSLESLSRALCSLSPFILDAGHPKADRYTARAPPAAPPDLVFADVACRRCRRVLRRSPAGVACASFAAATAVGVG